MRGISANPGGDASETAEMSPKEDQLSPFLVLAAAIAPAAPGSAAAPDDAIVVTATREPVATEASPASATVFDGDTKEALGLPFAIDLLRLAPGVSVSAAGPRGSQTQLRIRGAEANHTLLFIDGIRFNDPAAGNEPRLELLASDGLARLEIVRGPQSALWGSEALGGVVALDTIEPARRGALAALVEYGSLDSLRAGAQFTAGGDRAGLSGAAGWLRSDGIDSFGSGGERDGFENVHASLKGVVRPTEGVTLGLAGHWIEGDSAFDGFDPATFRRADTLDATENRIRAARGWVEARHRGWSILADLALLDSANRNRLDGAPLNSTFGERLATGAQLGREVGDHHLIAAIEHEREDFRARDQVYFGATDQVRSRSLTALVGEWRAEWSHLLSTDVALRHDSFSAFADSTTLRATILLAPAAGWRLHAAYGEGIAQPSFYDLFGFFPGSFLGNATLTPERSRGWEFGARWAAGAFAIGVTGFSNRLHDEIVDTFDPATFLSSTANADGTSRRRGIELDAAWQPSPALTLGVNYTYLDAEEQKVTGGLAIRELRRPRHSANLVAAGTAGRLSWGGTAAYVGKRGDTDFDAFPARAVTLGRYLLASFRLGWKLTDGLEVYGRVENGFDADYQDVVGYSTPGRAIHAGLRVRLGA